ncbi:MAG: formyltransferase family protein, partial [Gemmatimonadales bacterium]
MTAPTPPVRLAVLASGGGSNLQAIMDHLDALGEGRAAQVVLVASNRAGAGALDRARARHIPADIIADPADGPALVRLLDAHRVDLIALAGYLKLVPSEVTARWRGRIVNIHPALLPT